MRTRSVWDMFRSDLAEGERIGLNTGIEERDLERAVSDGASLPDKLIQPLLGSSADTLVVNVNAVSRARRLSID